jgi:hypothetical protein
MHKIAIRLAGRHVKALDGNWRVERISGLLPPGGVTKRIRCGAGTTRLFGFPIAVFRVQELALVYRLLPIRDEVTPKADGSWEGRGLLLGQEFCRFRLTPTRAYTASHSCGS